MAVNLTLYKAATCLMLVAVVVLLVYDVRLSAANRGQTPQVDDKLRKKRSVSADQQNGGVTYTHWGRSSCSNTSGAELVYSGVVGGSHYSHHGGGSNYLCMPMEPQWLNVDPAVANHAIVYGAEYQLQTNDFPFTKQSGKLHDHNVPCAVCRVGARGSVITIPARTSCYGDWTVEYYGYLMAGSHDHKGRNQFVCVDESPETDAAGYRDEDGILFYSAEGACGSLPCPPYTAGKELTCVVCTK